MTDYSNSLAFAVRKMDLKPGLVALSAWWMENPKEGVKDAIQIGEVLVESNQPTPEDGSYMWIMYGDDEILKKLHTDIGVAIYSMLVNIQVESVTSMIEELLDE